MGLVVQKYGGTSVGDLDKIGNVANRVIKTYKAGNDVVVVLSAMSGVTDDLIAMARKVSDNPDRRELDVLLATGEHISGTLVTMALHEQGIDAVSLTGPQAGIRTDTAHGRARIANIEPARIRREIERQQQFAEEDPRPLLRVQQVRVLADRPQPGPRRHQIRRDEKLRRVAADVSKSLKCNRNAIQRTSHAF